MPLIVTRWWPGSIIEQLKIIDPLTNPTAHGAHFAAQELRYSIQTVFAPALDTCADRSEDGAHML